MKAASITQLTPEARRFFHRRGNPDSAKAHDERRHAEGWTSHWFIFPTHREAIEGATRLDALDAFEVFTLWESETDDGPRWFVPAWAEGVATHPPLTGEPDGTVFPDLRGIYDGCEHDARGLEGLDPSDAVCAPLRAFFEGEEFATFVMDALDDHIDKLEGAVERAKKEVKRREA